MTNQNDIEQAALLVYAAYPRKVGGRRAAVTAIVKAIERLTSEGVDDPVGFLTQRTTLFASSIAGRSGIFTPYPATWFNRESYHDDPAEWNRNRSDCASGWDSV
jgi:hypothetical protein